MLAKVKHLVKRRLSKWLLLRVSIFLVLNFSTVVAIVYGMLFFCLLFRVLFLTNFYAIYANLVLYGFIFKRSSLVFWFFFHQRPASAYFIFMFETVYFSLIAYVLRGYLWCRYFTHKFNMSRFFALKGVFLSGIGLDFFVKPKTQRVLTSLTGSTIFVYFVNLVLKSFHKLKYWVGKGLLFRLF